MRLCKMVALFIFGKKIIPLPSPQKHTGKRLIHCRGLQLLLEFPETQPRLVRQRPLHHLFIRGHRQIHPACRRMFIQVFTEGHRFQPIRLLLQRSKEIVKILFLIDPLMSLRPSAEFFTVIGVRHRVKTPFFPITAQMFHEPPPADQMEWNSAGVLLMGNTPTENPSVSVI